MLTDMTEKIVNPLIEEPSQTGGTGQRRSRSVEKLEGWSQVGLSLRVELFLWKGWGGCFRMMLALPPSGKSCLPFPFLRGVEVILFAPSRLAWKGVTVV